MKRRPLIIDRMEQLPGRTVLITMPDGSQHKLPNSQVMLRPMNNTEGKPEIEVPFYVWKAMGFEERAEPLDKERVSVPDDLCEEPPQLVHHTPPKAHQEEACVQLLHLKVGALDMAVGEGKTKIAIDLATSRHIARRMDRLLFMAPVGALKNIREQITIHAGGSYTVYEFDECTGPEDADLQAALAAPGLVFFLAGTQSLSHGGKDMRVIKACQMIAGERTMMVLDEGDEYKGHDAKRTVLAHSLGAACRYRLVMSGTLAPESVRDIYTLYNFLDDRIISERRMATFERKFVTFDSFGRPSGSKNLHVLAARLAPYTYRHHPDDTDKVSYREVKVRLSAAHNAHYERMRDRMLKSAHFDKNSKHDLFRMYLALQQVLCGFVGEGEAGEDRRVERLVSPRENPKLLAMLAEVHKAQGPCIVWCKFRHELQDAAALLNETFPGQVSVFSGGQSRTEKEAARLAFASGQTRVFLSNAATGGRSLNGLQVATTSIYLSNTFKNTERIQSVGRVTRQPRTGVPEVVDIIAVKPDDRPTIDSLIMKAIHRKQDLLDVLEEEMDGAIGK